MYLAYYNMYNEYYEFFEPNYRSTESQLDIGEIITFLKVEKILRYKHFLDFFGGNSRVDLPLQYAIIVHF